MGVAESVSTMYQKKQKVTVGALGLCSGPAHQTPAVTGVRSTHAGVCQWRGGKAPAPVLPAVAGSAASGAGVWTKPSW